MKARIPHLMFAGLLLPLILQGQGIDQLNAVERVDIPALQERLKVAKPEERLQEIKELGTKISALRYLSLDDADALATALSNPQLGRNDGGKLLKSYVALGAKKDWASMPSVYGPLVQATLPAERDTGIKVSQEDFTRLMETIRKMGVTIKTQQEKISDLEAKLKEKEK